MATFSATQLWLWQRLTRRPIPLVDASPVCLLLHDGQSLSLGQVGSSLEKAAANRLDRHGVKMLGGLMTSSSMPVTVNGPMSSGYDRNVPSSGLVPAAADGNIAICLYIAAALRQRREAAGLLNPMIVTGCNGLGGQEILAFDEDATTGTNTAFGDLIHRMRGYWLSEAARVLAGRSLSVPYATFSQGEADSNAAKGSYRMGMDRMWDAWLDQIATITGQTPLPATTQVGGYCDSLLNKTYWPVIEQIQCVEARGGLILPPWYPHLLHDANVHPGDGGNREMSDLIAYHYAEHEAGRTVPAFRPITQVIGNRIVLTYPLRAGETLAWHNSAKYAGYGGFCDNQGFEVAGTMLTGVSLGADGSSVVLDCAGTPIGWRYAFQFQDVRGGAADGNNYSAHRGLLRKAAAITPTIAAGDLYQWALSWREDW